MGYDGRFSLEWKGGPAQESEPWKDLVAKVGLEQAKDLLEADALKFKRYTDYGGHIGDFIEAHDDMRFVLTRTGISRETGSWRTLKEDMTTLSKQLPKIRFTVYGQGPDAGDVWEWDFLDGKDSLRTAVLTIPPITLWDIWTEPEA